MTASSQVNPETNNPGGARPVSNRSFRRKRRGKGRCGHAATGARVEAEGAHGLSRMPLPTDHGARLRLQQQPQPVEESGVVRARQRLGSADLSLPLRSWDQQVGQVEHHMFCHIAQNRRGQAPISRKVATNLIGSETTKSGSSDLLRIRRKQLRGGPEGGVRVGECPVH